MAGAREPDGLGAPPERDQQDDQDLLTYGEAGIRLHQEIADQRALVTELERGGDAEVLSQASRRLEMLEEGYRRHARQRITAENFQKFFGYAGTPRRLTEER